MILLPLLILLPTLLWAAPAAPPVNIALNRPYATNVQTLPGWDGLVDGEKASDTAPGCFATANAPGYPKYAVIDLGGDCQISKVVVYNSGNGNTRTVSLACSVDGNSYKKLRDPDFIFTAGDPIALTVSFQPRAAHYVRVTLPDTWKGGLGGDNSLFLREVEVYGTRAAEAAKGDPFAFAASQTTFDSNRSVSVFKRYCLEAPGDLRVTVLGDSFTRDCEQDPHWAKTAAVELAKLYPNKRVTLSGVGGNESALAFASDWAQDHRGTLAPDLIIVAYGTHAALAGAGVEEFRQKYQALIADLAQNTQALVVPVTPLPFLPPDPHNSRPFADVVEQVARANGLPLLRTAAVLGKIPGSKNMLYTDATHLNPDGQQAVGTALADLLR